MKTPARAGEYIDMIKRIFPFVLVNLFVFAMASANAEEELSLRVEKAPDNFSLKHVILMNPGDMENLNLLGGEIIRICRSDDPDPKRCIEARAEYAAGIVKGSAMLDTFDMDRLGLKPGESTVLEITVTDKKYLDYDYFPLYPGFTWLVRGYETPGEIYTVIGRAGEKIAVKLTAIPYSMDKSKNLKPRVTEVYYYIDDTGIWQFDMGEKIYLLQFPIEVGKTWKTHDMLTGLPTVAEIVDTDFSITQRGRPFSHCVKIAVKGNYDLNNPDASHILTVVYAPLEGFLYQEPEERWRFYEELVLERRWD